MDRSDQDAFDMLALQVERFREESERNARDAARWRALLSSDRLRLLGSAGFGTTSSGQKAVDSRIPDPSGYRHFGMEFWTKHREKSSEHGARVLEAYADAILDHQAKLQEEYEVDNVEEESTLKP